MSSPDHPDPLIQIDTDEGPLQLREDEAVLVQEECASILAQPLPESARVNFSRLRAAAEAGEIPLELQESLQSLLDVGLESGRIQHLHGAHAAMAAFRLYGRLPRGTIYRKSVAEANEALTTLQDQVLGSASFQARGPGACALTIDAGSPYHYQYPAYGSFG